MEATDPYLVSAGLCCLHSLAWNVVLPGNPVVVVGKMEVAADLVVVERFVVPVDLCSMHSLT